MEVQWDRNARLSISRTSLWLNASNWLRICGIASGLTVRRSHSHLPRRRSLIDGWRSCGVVQTRESRGTLSAAGSTIACGGQIDDSSPRSACRRGGYRRSGALVRETFIGFGQRVPWLSGSEYRRCPANARCLPQNTRGRSTSPAPTLSVRAVLLAGTLGYSRHRVPARAARPGSLAASNWGRDRRLTPPSRDHLGRSSGPAESHDGVRRSMARTAGAATAPAPLLLIRFLHGIAFGITTVTTGTIVAGDMRSVCRQAGPI